MVYTVKLLKDSCAACLLFFQSQVHLLHSVLALLFIRLRTTHLISEPINDKEFKDFPLPIPRHPNDLSHHLARDALERVPNKIKDVWRMAQAKGPGKVITLANGKETSFPSEHCCAST
jgi:hypothetical protein